MSSRFGMADGRCFTQTEASNILYNMIAKKAGTSPMDSSKIREFLQSERGQRAIEQIMNPSSCLKISNVKI